ncbi:MAG: FliA/WhiG family RNA polymerase sigma factor [Planctomycetes bacterium]|nr:FliA/WhiG family RNA polymerase sigma factor [Planctomycetota bacterium]
MIRADESLRENLWRRFLAKRRNRWRNALAESYLPLVELLADEVAARVPRSVDPDDLISVGVFGLLQSLDSYDPQRNVKFETFCKVRIRGAMLDELRSADRLSRDARARARTVGGAKSLLRQELGREPTHHELAQRVALAPQAVERILATAATRNLLSLDVVTGQDREDDAVSLLSDDLVDPLGEPHEEAQRNDLLRLIDDSISKIERDLIRMRYGDGLTMRKIGRRLGLSESRVCQLHSRLILRLHRRLAPES